MKPSPRQRFSLLKAAFKYGRLKTQVDKLVEETREAEGTECGYCGGWNTWEQLTDESTQTEQRPLICRKCVQRRVRAHDGGWHDWPNRV